MMMLYKGEKLRYCECKHGNGGGCCSNVAKYNCVLKSKKGGVGPGFTFRCEAHKNKGTTNKSVVEVMPYDQMLKLQTVNDWLRQLIGKTIVSSYHSAKGLQVKYLKDNGGVMCFQPITEKWKYVYYNQIETILN